MPNSKNSLTHLRDDGTALMVDVGDKPVLRREATASASIHLQPGTISAITEGKVPKGDVFSVARIAGIQAAKRTSGLIPLCHQLPLTKASVDFEILKDSKIEVRTTVKTDAKTGVEMEALTAATVAALTVYDMCKAIDKTMRICDIVLVEKTKSAR